ncbi:DUF882 domain-containing protein [Oricola cellulosilytica]|uniref:Murein endopeptidase K n=2 Tax=Oricola cellulosilytica TaxID=1429082 RepID=A0A4R0P4F5_9HYPH|nr:DUF882 domain-containing protein [Oricola cellulosilytica]
MQTAEAETRTLKLYYVHTKERAEITYKKNGRYLQSGLNKLNRFLRDWRRNEPTRMDPELFDVIWEAYRMAGGRDYIHVVSAYRSPATNEMLRRTRGGQAKKSQHTLGKAMDFYIPGVKLSKLREIGFKLQGGGVGYYPKSGSPFVHFDTGNVRAWPRMSRSELARIFPKGGTLHLPPDGKPLPGYEQALASYQSRKRKGQATAIVSGGSDDSRKGGTLLAALFGGGADDEEDSVEAASPAPRPTRAVAPQPQPAAPEPETTTPQTLIAALTTRATPRPSSAPRPQADIPALAEQPVAVAAAAAPAGTTEPPRPLALVPVPDARPEALLARADARTDPGRRTASEIVNALNSATPQEDVKTLVASAPEATAAEALRIPLPVAAPREDQRSAPRIEIASLPVPASRADGSHSTAEGLISVAYAPAASPTAILADPAPGSPQPAATAVTGRVAPLNEPDRRILAAYDTGVITTGKSARPTATEAADRPDRDPSSELIPADQIDPGRFGSWTTASLSITDYGRPSDRPLFIQNALRGAPTEVYTDGFRKDAAPDPRRFSGNAVTFLAFARFEGGSGGDGQPLTLQLPLAN